MMDGGTWTGLVFVYINFLIKLSSFIIILMWCNVKIKDAMYSILQNIMLKLIK